LNGDNENDLSGAAAGASNSCCRARRLLDATLDYSNVFPKRHAVYTPAWTTSYSPGEIRIELLMLSNTQRRAVIEKR